MKLIGTPGKLAGLTIIAFITGGRWIGSNLFLVPA